MPSPQRLRYLDLRSRFVHVYGHGCTSPKLNKEVVEVPQSQIDRRNERTNSHVTHMSQSSDRTGQRIYQNVIKIPIQGSANTSSYFTATNGSCLDGTLCCNFHYFLEQRLSDIFSDLAGGNVGIFLTRTKKHPIAKPHW